MLIWEHFNSRNIEKYDQQNDYVLSVRNFSLLVKAISLLKRRYEGLRKMPRKCQQWKPEDLSLHPAFTHEPSCGEHSWDFSPGADVVAGCSQVALWNQLASRRVSFRVRDSKIRWRKSPEVDFWLPQRIYTEVHSLTCATFTHLRNTQTHTSAHTYVVKEE